MKPIQRLFGNCYFIKVFLNRIEINQWLMFINVAVYICPIVCCTTGQFSKVLAGSCSWAHKSERRRCGFLPTYSFFNQDLVLINWQDLNPTEAPSPLKTHFHTFIVSVELDPQRSSIVLAHLEPHNHSNVILFQIFALLSFDFETLNFTSLSRSERSICIGGRGVFFFQVFNSFLKIFTKWSIKHVLFI